MMFQSARCSQDSDSCYRGEQEHSAAADRVVTLSVGGSQYTTTVGTLTAVPGSYLSTLFGSQHWTPSVFVAGSQTPFIDRDPASFQYVLAYLRHLRYADSQLLLPESLSELKRLQTEAEFYGLPGLVQACNLGKWASGSYTGISRSAHLQQPPHPPPATAAGAAQLHPAVMQLSSTIYTAPMFSLLQQQSAGSNISSRRSSLTGILQAVRDDVRHPQAQRSSDDVADGTPVSGDEVQIGMQQHMVPCVAQCVCAAQQILAAQQQVWAANCEWQNLADLVLKHLLLLPLAAQQQDLVSAVANPKPSARLEFLLQYYPVGDLRIDLECRIVPDMADATVTAIPAAAAAGANAVAVASSPSPHLSPRDNSSTSRAGSLGSAAGALAAAAAAAVANSRPAAAATGEAAIGLSNSSACGTASVVPGPGWGWVTAYHRYSIRETSEQFVLTTHMPGEPLHVEEAARATFKQELRTYSTLHKLLVQQAPRSSVAGLMWLLQSAGFSSVKLSTLLDTYYVGSNAFPGFKSVITFEL